MGHLVDEPAAPVVERPNAPEGMEQFSSHLAARLQDAPAASVAGAIGEGLEWLAWTLDVDRCGLAEFEGDGARLRFTHRYVMPGSPAATADLGSLLPWYVQQVREGRTLVLSSLPDDLPPEAARDAAAFAQLGLKSTAMLPLRGDGKVLGGLCVASMRARRDWTPTIVSSLELLASVFASALQRLHSEQRARRAEAVNRTLLAKLPSKILVLDRAGRVVDVGKSWNVTHRCPDCPDAVAPGESYVDALTRGPMERFGTGPQSEEIRSVLEGTRDRLAVSLDCARNSNECRCDVQVVPLPGEHGGVIVVQTDVAELGRMKEALDRSQAEVRELKDRCDAETVYLRKAALHVHGFEEIVGTSRALSKVLHQIEQVAPVDSPILLLGETGTGKDLIARAIHDRSRRKDRPLIAVNCAALPDALIESELFGYEKGAFTGAVARTLGRFEVANGGTILLDEVGEMPQGVQSKLLRVLEGGTFERLGSSKTVQVDVRVIAATNRDLEREVQEGRFRADLYYRLNVFSIEVPPLRERAEDIPVLVWHFINAKQGPLGRSIQRVPDRLMRALETHQWPGNVRELENVIERALIVTSGSTLSLDLPVLGGSGPDTPLPPGTTLQEVERAHIEAVLRRCGWKLAGKGNAAETLGMKRGTLQFRMKKLGIRRPEPGV